MRARSVMPLFAVALTAAILAGCGGSSSPAIPAVPGSVRAPSARGTGGTPPPVAPPPGARDCATITAGPPSPAIVLIDANGKPQTSTVALAFSIRSCAPSSGTYDVVYTLQPRVAFGTCVAQTIGNVEPVIGAGASATLNLKVPVPNCGGGDNFTVTATVFAGDANTPISGTNGVPNSLASAQASFLTITSLPGLVNSVQTLSVALAADLGADPTAVSGSLVYTFDGTHMVFSGQPTLPVDEQTGVAIFLNGTFFQGSSTIGLRLCNTLCALAAFPSFFDQGHTFSPGAVAPLPADPVNLFVLPGDKIDVYAAAAVPPPFGSSFQVLVNPIVLGAHLASGVMALPPGGLGGGGAH